MAQQNSSELIAQGNNMAYQDFSPNAFTQTIWDYLYNVIGNEYGVAGMMGNLYHESHCYPNMLYGDSAPPTSLSINYTTRVDNHEMSRASFISSRAYGLAQWLSSGRKANLYDGVWTGGSQPSSGNSIGSLTRGLKMIEWELTEGGYGSTLTACQTATNTDYATERVFTLYEGAGDDTLGQRQHYAQQIYNTYAGGSTGDCHVYLTVNGNGTATVIPQSVNAGQDVTLTCTPASGEQLLNIVAYEIQSGQSIAVTVTTGSQIIPIYNDAMIEVYFSGTPPVPPTPTYLEKKRMPIWMYPMFRR